MFGESQEATQDLRSGKDNFRALFNIMPDPGVILDSQGKFLDLTDKTLEILGYKREELLGKNVFSTNILPAKAKATTIANLAKRMMGMRVAPYIVELLTKDGRKIHFEINATKIKFDGKQADLILFRDVSERKEMQDALEHEQERFRDIADSAGVWIWEMDANGNYTYSSPIVEQIIGYKPEEIIGRNFTEFFPSQDHKQKKLTLDVFLNKQRYNCFASCAVHKNGNVVFLEKNANPVFDQNGEFLGYRGVYRDITERREMQQRLMKTERFAAIGELAAMIAHDLRNPLQGIANGAFFLKKAMKAEKDPTTKEVFELVTEAVQHSNKIVNDLLEYSREIRLYLEESSPSLLVTDALSSVQIPPNVQVSSTRDSESNMKIDTDKMKRVLINLIKNSVDAMPNGGKLTITVKDQGPNIQFLISDTGIGMTKETLDKLWTPLFTTKAQGMGFGLAICRRIVEAHGGKISVDSVFGEGSTFSIIIPKKSENEGGTEVWLNLPESLLSTTTKP